MNYCENIQKSLDFIEQYLKDDIDINTVIRQSGFSTTHFYRIFQALIRETVKDYIRKRRLSEAAIDIVTSDKRIIDIAFDYCFNSQEVFTRAFAQLFGITPGRYRDYIYGAWLPYSGYEVAELDTIEAYDTASGSDDMNFEIYIPIK